jgi:hypothetical protein
MNIPLLTPLDIATIVLAIITLLLVIVTFRMGSEAKEQTKATLGMVEELKQDRKARTTPFVAVTRAWAQSNYQKGSGLSNTIIYVRVRNLKEEPAIHVEATLVDPLPSFRPAEDYLTDMGEDLTLEGAWDLAVGVIEKNHSVEELAKHITLQINYRDIEEKWWKVRVPLRLQNSEDVGSEDRRVWLDFSVVDTNYKSEYIPERPERNNVISLAELGLDPNPPEAFIPRGGRWKGPLGRQGKLKGEELYADASDQAMQLRRLNEQLRQLNEHVYNIERHIVVGQPSNSSAERPKVGE